MTKEINRQVEALEKENESLKKEVEELNYTCDELIRQLKQAVGSDYYYEVTPVRETEYDRRPFEYLINETLVELEITPDIWDVSEISLLAEATVWRLLDFLEDTFGVKRMVSEIGLYTLSHDPAVRKKAHDFMLSIALEGDIGARYGMTVRKAPMEEYYKES